MKREGRGTAERLLEGEGLQPWPEQNTAVLEARRRALSNLRGEVQNDSHYGVGGEEVEEEATALERHDGVLPQLGELQ